MPLLECANCGATGVSLAGPSEEMLCAQCAPELHGGDTTERSGNKMLAAIERAVSSSTSPAKHNPQRFIEVLRELGYDVVPSEVAE